MCQLLAPSVLIAGYVAEFNEEKTARPKDTPLLATTVELRSVGGTGVPTGWSSGTTDSVIALA